MHVTYGMVAGLSQIMFGLFLMFDSIFSTSGYDSYGSITNIIY